MRKAHMEAVIDGLQNRIKDLEKQRDEARNAVSEGLSKLHRHAKDHSDGLAKVGEDLSGLAEAVRAAIKPEPEPAPEPEPPAESVTPISAKRVTKAAG